MGENGEIVEEQLDLEQLGHNQANQNTRRKRCVTICSFALVFFLASFLIGMCTYALSSSSDSEKQKLTNAVTSSLVAFALCVLLTAWVFKFSGPPQNIENQNININDHVEANEGTPILDNAQPGLTP